MGTNKENNSGDDDGQLAAAAVVSAPAPPLTPPAPPSSSSSLPQHLPVTALYHVLEYVPDAPRSVCDLELTCRQFHEASVRQGDLWRALRRRRWTYDSGKSGKGGGSSRSSTGAAGTTAATTTTVDDKKEYARRHLVDRETVRTLDALFCSMHDVDDDGTTDRASATTADAAAATAEALIGLLRRGRDVIDVCWSYYFNGNNNRKGGSDSSTTAVGIEKKRRDFAMSILMLLQRATVFEDLMDAYYNSQTQEQGDDDAKGGSDVDDGDSYDNRCRRLEEYAILSGLLFTSGTAYRNFDAVARRVRDAVDGIARDVERRFEHRRRAASTGTQQRQTRPRELTPDEKVSIANEVLFEVEGYVCEDVSAYATETDAHGHHRATSSALVRSMLFHAALQQRKGVPLQLAILYKCIMHRIGVKAEIMGLPGNVVVVEIPSIGRYVDVLNMHSGNGRLLLDHDDVERIIDGSGLFPFFHEFLAPLTPFTPEDALRRICKSISSTSAADAVVQEQTGGSDAVVVVDDDDRIDREDYDGYRISSSQQQQHQQQVLMVQLVSMLLNNTDRAVLTDKCYRGLVQRWITEQQQR